MAAGAPDVSIVLPAHNEAGNIAPIAAAIAQAMALAGSYEIVFVDDGSTDGTLAAIRAAARDPAIRYVSFTRNFGHQAALRAGMRHARGRAVIVMDCDFEHPPELIPKLVAAWNAGAKIVATPARRRGRGGAQAALLAALLSRSSTRSATCASSRAVPTTCCSTARWSTSSTEWKTRTSSCAGWCAGSASRSPRFPTSAARARAATASSRRRAWWSLRSPASRRTACGPLRFAIWLALGFALLSVLFIVYAFVSFLFVQHTVAGWSSLIAVIAILGAAQLLVLGIVGEYVGRILRETMRRPSYIVAETEAERTSSASKPAEPADRITR